MPSRKVGVLGSGGVGETLASGFLKHGYEVMRGSRDPAKLAGWKAKAGARTSVGTFEQAAKFGEIVVLAVKGTGAESALKLCGIENLADKTVIDATNPIAEEPPNNGAIRFFTEINDSLMERLQRLAPMARFVKAFSCIGQALMVNPDFGGQKPTMFIAGNDAGAKADVAAILAQFGHEVEDMGGAEGARAIEPLCILWCLPGLLRNEWAHALKMIRPN